MSPEERAARVEQIRVKLQDRPVWYARCRDEMFLLAELDRVTALEANARQLRDVYQTERWELTKERDAAIAEREEWIKREKRQHDRADAALARAEQLREAIATHLGCFTACKRCGWEMSNVDDDVGLALASTAPPVERSETKEQ